MGSLGVKYEIYIKSTTVPKGSEEKTNPENNENCFNPGEKQKIVGIIFE